jgi:hypothetical protein
MRDWAQSLSEQLEKADSGLARALGIDDPNITAADFEEALGAFSRWANEGLDLSERFMGLGGPNAGANDGRVQEWLKRSRSRVELVTEALRDSTYKQFGREAIDDQKARTSYSRLIDHLDLGPGEFLGATTNYDPSMEMGVSSPDRQINTGFLDTPAWDTPTLRVSGMVDWQRQHGSRVPILHLHGAVGWYRRSDGSIAQYPADQRYNRTLGIPVFLPPDPAKDPTNDANVAEIWDEFRTALSSATHVLALGHSLNDPALITAIRDVGPQANLLVATLYPNRDLIDERLPEAEIIELEFGPSFDSPELRDWASRTAKRREYQPR